MLLSRLQNVLPNTGAGDRRPALLQKVAALPEDLTRPQTVLAKRASAGLLAKTVSGDYGGASETISISALYLLRGALAYVSPLYDLMFAMQGLGSAAVALFGSAAQKAAFLPRVAQGSANCALALTEPDAGSDLSAIKTTAQLRNEEYEIKGDIGQPGQGMALAEMATDCTQAALLVQHAAALLDGGEEATAALPSAMAKLAATEMAQRVVDRALQLHGGQGLLAGSRIERLYRDVRSLRIYEGTSEIQKLIIARQLLL